MRRGSKYTRQQRIEIAEKALREGRVGQFSFRRMERGREMVCALSAFGPDIDGTMDCPADFMPYWLASAVPLIDDSIPAEHVPVFVQGLIDRARQWHKLSRLDWDTAQRQYRHCLAHLMKDVEGPMRWVEAKQRYDIGLTLEARLFAILDEALERVSRETSEAPAEKN